jgi:hypothetical protein
MERRGWYELGTDGTVCEIGAMLRYYINEIEKQEVKEYLLLQTMTMENICFNVLIQGY